MRLMRRPDARVAKIILHIGAPKTGSTSIQSFLSRNRADLRREGVLYPNSLGRTAHQAFAAAMGGLFTKDGLRRSLGLTSPRAVIRLRRDLYAALDREINAKCPEVVIISCENLFPDVRRVADARRIRRFLSGFSRDIEVVVYLRRQDRAMFSAWAHSLRIGKSVSFIPPSRLSRGDRYDYASRLSVWRRVFGRNAIHVRSFDAVRGDVVDDFIGQAGVRELHSGGERANGSLDAVKAAFMSEMNMHLPRFDCQIVNPARGDLANAIGQVPSLAAPPRIAAEDARAILKLYAQSNRRLEREWNDDLPFFDDDIKEAPANDPVMEIGDVILIASQLWTGKQREIDALKERLRAFEERAYQVRARPSPRTSHLNVQTTRAGAH